jgi:hypothetical protein
LIVGELTHDGRLQQDLAKKRWQLSLCMIERISTQRIADHSGLCMPKMIIQLLYHNRNWIIKWQKAKVDAKRSNDPLVVASL